MVTVFTTCLLKVALIFVSSISFDNELNRYIIMVVMLLAGIIINIGSVIQGIKNLRKTSSKLSLLYLYLLVGGCLVLFCGQLAGVIKTYNFDLLISSLTSLLSFACSSFLLITTLYVKHRVPVTIVLEGIAGSGKTFMASKSFDYFSFLTQYPIYKTKHESSVINTLYNINLQSLLQMYKGEDKINFIDRDILSQVVYSLLLQLNGSHINFKDFKLQADSILNDLEFKQILKDALTNYYKTHTNYKVKVIIPKNYDAVLFYSNSVIKRQGFEVDLEFDIVNYTLNQAYMFKRIVEIINLKNVQLIYADNFVSHFI